MVDIAAGLDEPAAPEIKKDPAAVARGRPGGLKGGKARADQLSKAEKVEIAKVAAKKLGQDLVSPEPFKLLKRQLWQRIPTRIPDIQKTSELLPIF